MPTDDVTELAIINGRTEDVKIRSIRPHPGNPNKGDLESIRGSVMSSGFYGFVVCQLSRKRILVGEHRWQVLKEQGSKIVPVLWVDVDDDVAMDILLADNRTAELAERDLVALTKLLVKALKRERGMEGTGYTEEGAKKLIDQVRLYREGEGGGSKEEDFWPMPLPMRIPQDVHDRWTKMVKAHIVEGEPVWMAVGRIMDVVEKS